MRGQNMAKQLETDLQPLLSLDSAAERLAGIGNIFFLLFTDFRHDFVQVDCGELRAQFFGVCIPPPGFCEAVPGEVEAAPSGSSDLPHQFICDCTNDDGSVCTASFSSFRALAMHIRRADGGTHGKNHDRVRAAICNQCPWCKNIFASVRVTQQHIGSAFATAVIEPPLL